jgi:hypothetical protein
MHLADLQLALIQSQSPRAAALRVLEKFTLAGLRKE